MSMRERFEGLARAAAKRPVLTLGIVMALALAGGLLALGLEPDAGTGTFVSSSSASFQATESDHQHFGGDAVVVLIREPLTDLVETRDLATVSQLEACLAGQVVVANNTLGSFTPASGSQRAYGGPNSPCGHLMRAKPVQDVSPITAITLNMLDPRNAITMRIRKNVRVINKIPSIILGRMAQ